MLVRGHGTSRAFAGLVVVAAMLLGACSSAGPGGATNTVAFIPGYQPGGGTTTEAKAAPQGYPPFSQPIRVALGDTSSTQTYIHLSQDFAPQGQVSFIITNESTSMKHELVGFATKTMAADFPITGFEGDPNKIDEDAAGKAVLDTGAALAPGASKMITIAMDPGHYALVCNLSGHYAAGMHVDFWVMPV